MEETQDEKEKRLTQKWTGRLAEPYSVARVQTLYNPHPFMIGPEHFPRDGSTYIKPEQAPCAMRRCGLPYTEHKSSLTLLVRVPEKLGKTLPADLGEQLKAIVAEAEADGIVGFGFLEPGRE